MVWDQLPEAAEPYRPALVRGRYRVNRVLHRGKRGDVVIAVDVRQGNDVVLKRIFDPSIDDITRLRAVHQVLGSIEHPRVMGTVELVETRSDAWLVCGRVPGTNLMRWWHALPLSANAPFEARWIHAAPLVAGLLQAMETFHGRQLAHLDIKPHNVLVGRAGEVTLVDIGLGAPPAGVDTRSMAEIFDRSGYVAPEMLGGGRPSRRADQWSLGALLYELLTGQKAVPGHTPLELGRAYKLGRVQPVREWRPETPSAVAETVSRLLRWDPEDRYPSISAVRQAFGEALTAPIEGVPQIWSVRRPPLVGRESLDTFFRRRLLDLRSRRSSILRLVDGPGTGKSALLRRWAKQAAQDPSVQVLTASCVPQSPRAVLHRWFRPPLVNPDHPPPPNLVAQALDRLRRPTIVLLDGLEDVDAVVWARIQRTADHIASGEVARPLMLVLAGRALGGLSPEVEGSERLFNITLTPLRSEHLSQMLHPDDDDAQDRALTERLADSYVRSTGGLPGKLIPLLLEEQREGHLDRRGQFWVPLHDGGGAPPPTVEPPALEEMLGYLTLLGEWVEVELALACLPMGRVEVLAGLAWAEESGLLEFREIGDRWMLRLKNLGNRPWPDLPAVQGTHALAARWLENTGEYAGLAAERTAEHWRSASEPGRAADAYERAGKAQSGIGSSSDARRLFALSKLHEGRRSGKTHPGRSRAMTDPRFRLSSDD